MEQAPMIVGPFGLTLQWYLGLLTGALLCGAFVMNVLAWRRASDRREIREAE